MQGAISLTQQLNYYREYQAKVVTMVGREKADEIFANGIHLLSAGSSDFIQNYYINPLLRIYSPDRFSDVLMRSYSSFIQVSSCKECSFLYKYVRLKMKKGIKTQ